MMFASTGPRADGVSMGAALGPVLANIIMTELEQVVVDRKWKDQVLCALR